MMKLNLPGMLTDAKGYFKNEFLMEIFASLLFCAGINVFAAPNEIVSGGVSGIATIIYSLTGAPMGTVSLILNLPLIVIGFRHIGKGFMLQTLRVTVIITVIMDWLMPYVPIYEGEKLLAALFGGVLTGAGLALIFMRGGSTGGTDIIVKLIQLKHPHMSLGKVVMLTDIVVVLVAAAVYEGLETVLYGIVMIYATGEVIDRMVKGTDARWMILVFTNKRREIAARVMYEMNRGATYLNGVGAFSDNTAPILLCVLDTREMFALKRIIHALDPGAFVIVSEAAEILGEGFNINNPYE